MSLAKDATINSSFTVVEPPPKPLEPDPEEPPPQPLPESDAATIASPRASGTEVYRVSTQTDPLRLRSGTGTNYKILAMYNKGTEVIVVNKTTSSWYEVTCPDGKHGYQGGSCRTQL